MAKVLLDKDGPVWTMTLNRREVHNCVDGETAEQIATSINEFSEDESASVLVVTGAGEKSFCSGADLKNIGSLMTHRFRDSAGPMGFTRLDPGKPTIAAINGYCFAGGFELALWCDFRIAAENAEFGVLNRRWGVPLVDGGTQRLARVAGMGNALFLIETGARIDVRRAVQMGIVQELVPTGQALSRAHELAQAMAAYPQSSLRGDRSAALSGFGRPLSDGLDLEARGRGDDVLADEMAKGLNRYVTGDRPEAPR
jgi:enoyl-CoA hydratase